MYLNYDLQKKNTKDRASAPKNFFWVAQREMTCVLENKTGGATNFEER